MYVDQNDMPIEAETTDVKHSKADVRGKARTALEVRFEAQNLTSYSGLILFQHFFSLISIKARLWGCFRHLKVSPIYSHHMIMMLLVVRVTDGCGMWTTIEMTRWSSEYWVLSVCRMYPH